MKCLYGALFLASFSCATIAMEQSPTPVSAADGERRVAGIEAAQQSIRNLRVATEQASMQSKKNASALAHIELIIFVPVALFALSIAGCCLYAYYAEENPKEKNTNGNTV